MLQSLLSGQLTKDGSGPGAMDALGGAMSGAGGNLAPLLLLMAGMGLEKLPRLLNSIMDFQQVGKGDTQQDPGALASPAEPPLPPPGMGGMPPGMGPGPMPGPDGAGGPPPGLVNALMQIAARRQMMGAGGA